MIGAQRVGRNDIVLGDIITHVDGQVPFEMTLRINGQVWGSRPDPIQQNETTGTSEPFSNTMADSASFTVIVLPDFLTLAHALIAVSQPVTVYIFDASRDASVDLPVEKDKEEPLYLGGARLLPNTLDGDSPTDPANERPDFFVLRPQGRP